MLRYGIAKVLFLFLAGVLPLQAAVPTYTATVVNTYPHDPNAFTQGLVFEDGFLFEGTGRNGQSSLRKVILETGEILQRSNLNARYFGEGITVMNDNIYQLTWQT